MITRYVNRGSTAGGTGITDATVGTDRAYASMAEAEASIPATITDDYTFWCSGTPEEVSNVTMSGWTGDYWIEFKAQPTDVASYSWDDSRYIAASLSIQSSRTLVSNLQMRQIYISGAYSYADSCFIQDLSTTGTGAAAELVARLNVAEAPGVINSIILTRNATVNSYSVKIHSVQSNYAAYLINCTCLGGDYGIYVTHDTPNTGNIDVSSCYARSWNPGSLKSISGPASFAIRCATGDNSYQYYGLSAYGGCFRALYSSTSEAFFLNITEGVEDLRTNSSSSLNDISSVPNGPALDLLGRVRGTPYTIGAIEFMFKHRPFPSFRAAE